MSIDKITSDDALSQSKDLVQDNIDKLKELFPEIMTEGKIDFKVLQQVLGEELEEEEEYYRFTWAGKSQARREAHKPSTGTLRPAKEESLDWDTTQNMYVEGDNLEVLKLMQKSYAGKIKMIYIDPPYNTGNDFLYEDDYKDNLSNYLSLTGQKNIDKNLISTNSETDGRFHSKWLNIMYPRLRLSRNLLSNNGIIFISIGEDEVSNLKKCCDEIFGQSNFISIAPRVQKKGGNKGNYFNPVVDYVLVYSKNIDSLPFFVDTVDEKIYNKVETSGKRKGEKYCEVVIYMPNLDYRPNQRFYVDAPDGSKIIPPQNKSFRWSKDRFEEELRKGNVAIKKTKNSKLIDENSNKSDWIVYQKRFLNDTLDNESARPNNLFENFQNMKGSSDLKKIGLEYSYPKPVDLIKKLLFLSKTRNNEIVLDFFSGSGTTSQSVIEYNLEQNQSLKFILVQIPEKVVLKDFNTLSDIGKERIRRVVKKIKEEHPEKSKEMDLGFKVFKLDSSNIKSWDGNPENLNESLFDAVGNIKTDRTEEDVLYEILLKYGLDLTLPIEEKTIEGKKVFNVGLGSLFICLADGITSKVAEGIGQWKENCSPEICRVIFKDNGFTDVEKTNSVQTLKRYGINEIRSI